MRSGDTHVVDMDPVSFFQEVEIAGSVQDPTGALEDVLQKIQEVDDEDDEGGEEDDS